jgi:phospholipase C
MRDRGQRGGTARESVWRAAARLEVELGRLLTRRRAATGPGPDPSRPVGSDRLPQIKHIVVLMMENHSYDNYFGMLERGDGFPLDGEGEPTCTNSSPGGVPVTAHRLTATTQTEAVPSQSWEDTHAQWNGGANDGFVRSAANQPGAEDATLAMGYWNENDLPFYYGLARTFPVADRWFSSCLGPTFPNRRFLVAGTAHGLTTDALSECFDRAANGTIFDLLNRHGISWANYHPEPHPTHALTRLLGVHGLRAGRKARSTVESTLRPDDVNPKTFMQFTADAYPAGLLRYLGHIHKVERFYADAANGTLPAFSIVDPDFRTSSEENPQDIQDGEAYAASIVNAVLDGPAWMHTLLIWVYDEHGGYYDHVPPPEAVEPDDTPPRRGGPWRYDRYGFRVPAVIVSPYARPDYVSHVVHDHTSILKLIETKWNLPPLTRRDEHADDLLDSLDLSSPPAFATPPRLPAPALDARDAAPSPA